MVILFQIDVCFLPTIANRAVAVEVDLAKDRDPILPKRVTASRSSLD
jgi:hypothetical protein